MAPKTVLITGCGASGIGAALAKEFHQRGHHVFASGRTAEEIDSSLSDLGIQTTVLDVTSTASIEEAVRRVRTKTGEPLMC